MRLAEPRLHQRGFTLIEMILVIIIIGIMASVAVGPGQRLFSAARTEETKHEMDAIAFAITGNPVLENNGTRSDFGYVGDVGGLPPNLDALYTNPGSYSTWKGPYISNRIAQVADDYKNDEWGTLYSYTAGATLTSTGSGSNIVRRIAASTGDLLYNSASGNVFDLDGTPPGSDYDDSVTVRLVIPNGSGSTSIKSTTVDPGGYFSFDSIPIGNHDLTIIYEPSNDTLRRFVSVLPASNLYGVYHLAANVWSGGAAGSSSVYMLRPDNVGSLTNLTASGCGLNYLCVDEGNPDEDATAVNRAANSYATDVYSLEDPPGTSGSINNVTVYCRARKHQSQGSVRPTVYFNATEYNGAEQDLTTSFSDYSHEWATNPNTGSAWTWSEINALQAGASIKGQNSNFPAYCTQVWVEVSYID